MGVQDIVSVLNGGTRLRSERSLGPCASVTAGRFLNIPIIYPKHAQWKSGLPCLGICMWHPLQCVCVRIYICNLLFTMNITALVPLVSGQCSRTKSTPVVVQPSFCTLSSAVASPNQSSFSTRLLPCPSPVPLWQPPFYFLTHWYLLRVSLVAGLFHPHNALM